MAKFEPFVHMDIDSKRDLLAIARRQYARANDDKENDDDRLACALSAALLYMNHADYLSQWFAWSIQEMANDAVKDYFSRQISVKVEKTKDITIGKAIDIIKTYEFSNKAELIELLGKINKTRNDIAHTILKIERQKWSDIDQAIEQLVVDTEELISFTDQFKAGMPPKTLRDILLDN